MDITCIQGNHDEGIGYSKQDFPFSYANAGQKEFGHLSIHHVNSTILADHLRYLSRLPFMLQLEFRFPFNRFRLAMVHGSPLSNNDYFRENTSEHELLEMLKAANADLLLMGHTHIPYHKAIFCEEENRKIYRHIINVGSVGKPKHGDMDACYCLVQINHETDLSDPASVQVEFKYISYDTEPVIEKIRSIGLPDGYDAYLSNSK